MNKIIPILLFLSSHLSFAIGITDWKQTTPNGNEMNNFNGISLVFKSGNTVDNLFKWYFYKDHIVCVTVDAWTDEMKFSYAVINEKTETIKHFQDEKEWQSYIENSNLKPTIWTRWYKSDWSIFSSSRGVNLFYLLIPILLFFYSLMKKSNPLLRKIAFVCTFVVSIYYLLNYFPESL